MTCGAQWIESAEVFCQRESGHIQGHISKAEILYENGVIGKVEISWVGFANLPPIAAGQGVKTDGRESLRSKDVC